MEKNVYRGTKTYRPFFLNRFILNLVNHRIAGRNIKKFPQLAILSFDNIGLVVNLDGRYESDSLEALERFLVQHLRIDTEAAVLDIGANIGNHSVFFSRIFSKVFAFEPNPKVFNLLKFNSDGTNIVPLAYGLSNENTILNFSIDPSNLGASRVVGESSQVVTLGPSSSIEVRRLDDESQIMDQSVSLIKIDVEGHELQVLQGAAGLIEAKRPIIVFEQSADAFFDGASQVTEFLRHRNYRFFTIRNNFYLGQGIPARSISLLLRMIFGFRKDIVPTEHFAKRFYDMIVAVPV